MDYIGLLTEYSSCCDSGSDMHLVNLTPQALSLCKWFKRSCNKKLRHLQLDSSSRPPYLKRDEKVFKSQLAFFSLGDGSKKWVGRGETLLY